MTPRQEALARRTKVAALTLPAGTRIQEQYAEGVDVTRLDPGTTSASLGQLFLEVSAVEWSIDMSDALTVFALLGAARPSLPRRDALKAGRLLQRWALGDDDVLDAVAEIAVATMEGER